VATIALFNGTIDDPLRPPLPSKWGPKCTPRDMSNFEWPYLRNGSFIRSTSYFVLGQGFRGRRIEWHNFWLDQIQDGSRPPSWIITAAWPGFPATARLSCSGSFYILLFC